MTEPGRERARDIVFLHGQPGLGSDFRLVEGHLTGGSLADKHPRGGFRVFKPDRPGYGRSGVGAVSIERNVEVIAELADAAGVRDAIVVGHSYGGGIAAMLARERPDLVAGLVLAAPVGRPGDLGPVDRILAARVIGEVLTAGVIGVAGTVLPLLRVPASAVHGRVGRWMSTTLPDARLAHVATPVSGVWRSVVAEQRFLVSESGDVERAVDAISVPTSVVTGSWDVIVAPAISAAIAASVKGAQLKIVAGTGHFLTRDAPKVLAEAIGEVAARIEGRQS